jgi:dTDP-4-dehydrorhamnose 3,5-epimerase
MFETFDIQGPVLVRPKFFRDKRGYFTETYSSKLYQENGIEPDFLQDNVSLSTEVYTVRGLHFQTPPFAQAKLIRVQNGRILDLAVDLRSSSKTFGQYVAVELSAEHGEQLYVPAGFAHGFCTLEPNCLVAYKVSSFYAPSADAGLLWSDPSLGIKWPMDKEKAMVSEKDMSLQGFAGFVSPFL